MRIVFLTILLVLCVSNLRAQVSMQDYDYSDIDAFAKDLEYPGDISSLASELTNKYTLEREKARSVYSWIAFHIAYDLEGKRDRSKLTVEPVEVIEMGKSVCEGYANLFKAICDEGGLESEIIVGWAKNSSSDINNIKWADPDHAWNAVKIDNEWYLLDVTWGAGYTSSKGFTQEFKRKYFCTSPNDMALCHYPKEAKWLLGAEVTREQFETSPHFFYPYLELNASKLSQNNGCLKHGLFGKCKVSFETPVKISSITVKGKSGHSQAQYVKFTQVDDLVTFKFKVKKSSPKYIVFVNTDGAIEYLNCK